MELINKNDKGFFFSKIPVVLKLKYEKFNFADKDKVSGNYTMKRIKPLFKEETWNKQFEEIWHCFYFYEDDNKLFDKLRRDYKYYGDIETIRKIRLKDGYCNVSLKAIRNILPFLKKGYQYDRAVILGGVKNAFGKRWEYFEGSQSEIERDIIAILSEDNREGEAIQKIKEYLLSPILGYGFLQNDPHFSHLYHHSQDVERKDDLEKLIPEVENLRNPIVQQGLHETRRLVNELILKYRHQQGHDFHFDRIRIEMGRNLRSNKTQRQEMSFRIRQNEAKNDEARERLAEFGLQPSRENIQKYLMYKEIEERASTAQCPYTGKTISISDLLGVDNVIQIEHIVPFSVSLNDSFANKTLCESNFNREKGEKSPYQFYKENPDPNLWGVTSWEAIVERTFRLLPYNKARRFTSKMELDIEDFIQRQLNDSRYIAKKAVELISHVCKDVRVMPGQLTAELRHLWGLNNILQPVRKLEKANFDVDGEKSIRYFVIADQDGNVQTVHPKLNKRPSTNEDELLITGFVNKGVFSSQYLNNKIENPELHNGKYWATLKVANDISLISKYIERPFRNEKHIIFKGRIENGIFKNDTYGRIRTNEEDGSYWAKFQVASVKFEIPSKDHQPTPKRNQVVLFGNVINNSFKCFIYQCEADLPDGKYWIILDLDPESAEFLRTENPIPEIDDNQVLITATIDENGILVADNDQEFQRKINIKPGKYYTVIGLESINPKLFRIENEAPKPETGQNLIEGTIWVDKYTGEIKFDPKKNRDDHRHHAIDAITIALTEQGYLQRLSTYNAQRKEKQRQKLDSTENFPEPWLNFNNDVTFMVNRILVSHKKSNKTLTKNKKGFSVRGQLHKENVFGKRQAPKQESGYHRRIKITDLETNKHVNKVVDSTIRRLISRHLFENCGVEVHNPKGYKIPGDAFVKNGNWQLFLPNKKGDPVPIRKIRIKEVIGHAEQLKSNINQYVNPRNNHHVLIYKDHEGKLKEDVVTFWTMVERKLQGSELYQLPYEGKEIVTTIEINDMFLLKLGKEEYESCKNDFSKLSKHLYKIEAVSSKYYEMRHHLESSQKREYAPFYYIISSLGSGIKGWKTFDPIKVKVDTLGNIFCL